MMRMRCSIPSSLYSSITVNFLLIDVSSVEFISIKTAIIIIKLHIAVLVESASNQMDSHIFSKKLCSETGNEKSHNYLIKRML
jgi:hypothetical protein